MDAHWRVVGPEGRAVGEWETLAGAAKLMATLLAQMKPGQKLSVYRDLTAVYIVESVDEIVAWMDWESDRRYVMITRADAGDCHDPGMSTDSQRLLNAEITRFKLFSDLAAAAEELMEKRPTATVTVLYGDVRKSKPQQAGPMQVGNDVLEEIKTNSVYG